MDCYVVLVIQLSAKQYDLNDLNASLHSLHVSVFKKNTTSSFTNQILRIMRVFYSWCKSLQ